MKDPEGQVARWLEKLQEFNFEVVHRRGLQHTNADALSRLPCTQCGLSEKGEEGSGIMPIAVTQLAGLDTVELQQKQL